MRPRPHPRQLAACWLLALLACRAHQADAAQRSAAAAPPAGSGAGGSISGAAGSKTLASLPSTSGAPAPALRAAAAAGSNSTTGSGGKNGTSTGSATSTSSATGGSSQAPAAASTSLDELVQRIATVVDTLRCSVVDWWLSHGVDGPNGMHATLSREGNPMPPTVKLLVAQARHLWAFSRFAAALQGRPSAVSRVARSQAAFLLRAFADPADGAFFAEVSRDGRNVTDPRKEFADQAPAVSALAAFGRQFSDAAALEAAAAAFAAWDAAVHDRQRGGYADGRAPGTGGANVAELAQSGAALAARGRKALNTQLHALLMVGDLARAAPGNAVLQQRLAELLRLLVGPMVVRSSTSARGGGGGNGTGGGAASAGLPLAYVPSTFAFDWSDPSVKQVTFFGLQAEFVWYVSAALDLAEQVGAMDAAEADRARAVVADVGATFAREGWDERHGGFFHAAVVDPQQLAANGSDAAAAAAAVAAAAVLARTEKTWWGQLEGLLALMSMWRATRDRRYLEQLERALNFIREHLWDEQHGELYMAAAADGTLLDSFACGGAAGNVSVAEVKACGNKASWHTGRALVQLHEWLLDEGVRGGESCNGVTGPAAGEP